MQHSNAQNARGESDRATNNAILNTMNSGIEMYKAVHAHDSFRNHGYGIQRHLFKTICPHYRYMS